MLTPHSHRLIQILGDHLPEMTATHLSGEEAVSQGFQFTLTGYSSELNRERFPKIHDPITLALFHPEQRGDMPVRYINGLISGFTSGEISRDQKRHYEIEITPWFFRFDQVIESRIFQHQSAVEIFSMLCKEQGYVDYDLSGIKKKQPKCQVIVQYQESTYHFLQRIFQLAGISYYYRHEHGKHILCLIEEFNSAPQILDSPIDAWKEESRFHASRLTLGDYQFKKRDEVPFIPFMESIKSKNPNANVNGKHDFECYRYGDYYLSNDEDLLVTHRALQAIEWPHHTVSAAGQHPLSIMPGERFTLPNQDQRMTLLSLRHELSDSTSMSDQHENNPQQYHYTIMVLPEPYQHQPLPLLNKPTMEGVQQACVVGPNDSVVDTTPEGCVHLQFEWNQTSDRTYLPNVPVLQPLAGEGWGVQFIPRVGDVVLVSYLNADPDRPVVIGSIYTDENREPFPLPDNQNISGIQTELINHKTKQPTGQSHRLQFDDTPKHEKFILESAGDFNINVDDSMTEMIGGDEHIEISGDYFMQMLSGESVHEAKAFHLIVGDSRIDIDDNGVRFTTPKLNLLSKGGGDLKPAARVGDDHQCPKRSGTIAHKGGPILKGSTRVKFNHKASARKGDPLHCRIGKDQIKEGIESITIDGKPIAKVSHQTEHGGVITKGSQSVFIGEYDPNLLNALPIKATPLQRYWVKSDYPKPDDTYCHSEQRQQYGITYQTSDQIETQVGDTLDRYATGSQQLLPGDKLKAVSLSQSEIIAVNDKPVKFPADTIAITNDDAKAITAADKKPTREKTERTPKFGDKIIKTTLLHPPMIINLREDCEKHSPTTLSDADIQHLKEWGNNSTIFIHGFNVPAGAFSKQIESIKTTEIWSRFNSDSTLYQDMPLLQQRFSALEPCSQDRVNRILGALNGTGAYNWAIHIEDNLNRATGQFDRTDYRKFTRCVHVLWSGDVGGANYMKSEEKADAAGKALVELIKQLNEAKITINIIAHSMGNRVLLRMMDELGTQEPAEIIDHVFLCQAAVPNTALSSNPSLDISMKQNCHFIHAHKVAKKISVLYSDHDWVLWLLYPLGNHDVMLHHHMNSQDFLSASPTHQAKVKAYLSEIDKIKKETNKASWNEMEGNYWHDPLDQKMQAFTNSIQEDQLITATIRPALGYTGPDMQDKFMSDLENSGKLIRAKTSQWIHGHSAMKHGTTEIINHIYHDIIYKSEGFKFGLW